MSSAGAVVLVAVLFSAWPAAASEAIYEGEHDSARVFTNIPQGRGFRPLAGFSRASSTESARSASLARPRAFDDLIESTARQHRIHPELVRAVIRVESAFDPGAVSRKGARGLMQLMPDTAKRYDVHNLFDPVQNIRAGVQHLAYLSDRFGEDLDLVLAAYNAGEEAVRRYRGVPDFDETRTYVARIKKLFPGPIRLRDSALAERPSFFSYEDEEGVLHVSDQPLSPAPSGSACRDC
ncbi:MAG: lytic transglycosylase domain-containing protein [Anaerolineales bacterium]